MRRITRAGTIISSPRSRSRSRCAHVRRSYLAPLPPPPVARSRFSRARHGTQFARRIPCGATRRIPVRCPSGRITSIAPRAMKLMRADHNTVRKESILIKRPTWVSGSRSQMVISDGFICIRRKECLEYRAAIVHRVTKACEFDNGR